MSQEDQRFVFPRGVLFDMDGTLTRPMLDFPRIKAEMGIGDRPILEAMAQMAPGDRAMAEVILRRHEEDAAERSELNEGCHELLQWLDGRRTRVALVTRNSRRSVRTVLRRHRLSVDVLITREDARFKPDPEPLHRACWRLGLDAAEAWMIGDSHHDIEAGRAAGMPTVWISHGRERYFTAEPTWTKRDLCELLGWMRG
jgi:HAD superfamily hydrolase (TIGR01509 family)